MIAHGMELAKHYGCAGTRARRPSSSTLLEREILSAFRERPGRLLAFRVMYVGGFLRHEKGIDTLLAAYRQLLTKLPDAELEIVGGRDSVEHGIDAALRQEIESLGDLGAIRLLGHLPFGPQLFQALANADVLAVPSRSEGTPRVLVEARAFGCPVVGSAVGGIPTSIDDGIDGLLVPPNDPEALCRALLRIAGDEPLRKRLVSGGVDRARHCTVEAFAELIFDEALRLHHQFAAPNAALLPRECSVSDPSR